MKREYCEVFFGCNEGVFNFGFHFILSSRKHKKQCLMEQIYLFLLFLLLHICFILENKQMCKHKQIQSKLENKFTSIMYNTILLGNFVFRI